eukprot:2054017-Pleurochrysis_carterae.AAC.3
MTKYVTSTLLAELETGCGKVRTLLRHLLVRHSTCTHAATRPSRAGAANADGSARKGAICIAATTGGA